MRHNDDWKIVVTRQDSKQSASERCRRVNGSEERGPILAIRAAAASRFNCVFGLKGIGKPCLGLVLGKSHTHRLAVAANGFKEHHHHPRAEIASLKSPIWSTISLTFYIWFELTTTTTINSTLYRQFRCAENADLNCSLHKKKLFCDRVLCVSEWVLNANQNAPKNTRKLLWVHILCDIRTFFLCAPIFSDKT